MLKSRLQNFTWIVPLVFVVGVYVVASEINAIRSPDSRVFPTVATLWKALDWSTSPNSINGDIALVNDTVASVARLLGSLAIAGAVSVLTALAFVRNSKLRRMFLPTVVILSKIPVIAALPLLLIWAGFGESAKILLIVLGVFPVMTVQLVDQLDVLNSVFKAKVKSLGLPTGQQAVLIWIPLVLPAFIAILQASLGAAWLFLIVAESFGTSSGLGYRIFIIRTRVWMDVILVYVVWVAVLSILLHAALGVIKTRLDWSWN